MNLNSADRSNSQRKQGQSSGSDIQRAIAWRITAQAAERMHSNPDRGRHGELLRLGYDLRREGVPLEVALQVVSEALSLFRETDSEGQIKPLTADECMRAVENAYQSSKEVKPRSSGRELTLGDWTLNRYVGDAPERRMLVSGLIPRPGLALLAAMGDTGKSLLRAGTRTEGCGRKAPMANGVARRRRSRLGDRSSSPGRRR